MNDVDSTGPLAGIMELRPAEKTLEYAVSGSQADAIHEILQDSQPAGLMACVALKSINRLQ